MDLLFKQIMVCKECNFKADVMKTPVPSDEFNGFCPVCGHMLHDVNDATMRGLTHDE